MEGLERQGHKTTRGRFHGRKGWSLESTLGSWGLCWVEVPGGPECPGVEGRPGCVVGDGNLSGAPGGPGREQEEA